LCSSLSQVCGYMIIAYVSVSGKYEMVYGDNQGLTRGDRQP